MDPVTALDRVATLLERKQAGRYKEQAFRKAADAIRDMPVDELRALAERGRIQSIPGVGSYTGPIANWSRWPNQPWMGERSEPCSSRRT